jgi:hypothetical protein
VNLHQLLDNPAQPKALPDQGAVATVPRDDLPVATEPSLSWLCSFLDCGKIRIYEGGRPDFSAFAQCEKCGSRVAVTLEDRASIARMIDLHLL